MPASIWGVVSVAYGRRVRWLADSRRVSVTPGSAAFDASTRTLMCRRGASALHDVDDGCRLENVVGLGLVDGGVVLGGQKDLLIVLEPLRAHGRSIPGPRRTGSSCKEDDHVPNGHHGSFLLSNFSLELGSTTRSPVSVLVASRVVSHCPQSFRHFGSRTD